MTVVKKVIITLSAAIIVAGAALPYIFDYTVENRINIQTGKILAQSLDYDAMDVEYLDDRIVINQLTMHDNGKPVSRFNAKANKVTFDVDYSYALTKSAQIQRITAEGVTLNVQYTGEGQSNFHNLQDNLKHYLSTRKNIKDSAKVEWDVHDMHLKDITVILSDNDIGEVGTFRIPELLVPRLSSSYSKQGNQDVLLTALGKAMVTELMAGTLQGDYSKLKLMAFAKRELQHETGEVTKNAKRAALKKTKALALDFINRRQGN